MSNDAPRDTRIPVIRELTHADMETLHQLEKQIFPDPWPKESFDEIFNNPDWRALIAEVNAEIVGYACILVSAGEMHLANIAVVEAWRRKSVARRLLERILELAIAEKCAMILLEVRVSNSGARAFYERNGFKELYTRKRYYRKPVEDALVMVRYLA
ncbi:MAG: ribosomal protein S18-alanine N-acetyltransferase [candidate division Zixibacteria bacterium]|nr:ribosomal protein S18-alanine N-acetyltransferase [candidate division Zixibacteria bacterium]